MEIQKKTMKSHSEYQAFESRFEHRNSLIRSDKLTIVNNRPHAAATATVTDVTVTFLEPVASEERFTEALNLMLPSFNVTSAHNFECDRNKKQLRTEKLL
jgi:hypothetical protein